ELWLLSELSQEWGFFFRFQPRQYKLGELLICEKLRQRQKIGLLPENLIVVVFTERSLHFLPAKS
ncbi:MAG: hypothetical protein PHT24_06990, partial [Endomicrobiaceae bacterium]|nr:hypothetical protein [Endomicrobiaceae bacterium]